MSSESEMSAGKSDALPLSAPPHRCPWWLHYLLASPLRKLVESPEKVLGPFVNAGDTVLDLGCGFGFFSIPLARLVGPTGRVIGVDVEPRAIAQLQRRARKAGLAERIDAQVCQPRNLGLADHAGQVDLITVMHTLHELEDLPGFLQQAAALLKPTGRLLVVEPPGHVSAQQFQAELNSCRQQGFRPRELPQGTRGRRQVALFAAP